MGPRCLLLLFFFPFYLFPSVELPMSYHVTLSFSMTIGLINFAMGDANVKCLGYILKILQVLIFDVIFFYD